MYFYLKGRYANYAARIDSIDADLAAVGFMGVFSKSYSPPQIMPRINLGVGYERRTVKLSRVVIERKVGRSLQTEEYAEHKNRNTLDNRRCNLRVASSSQNQANRPVTKCSTSGYKGVSWNKEMGKWQAQIGKDRRLRYLGRFSDKIEAAKAYDKAAKELFGEFAWLNFP